MSRAHIDEEALDAAVRERALDLAADDHTTLIEALTAVACDPGVDALSDKAADLIAASADALDLLALAVRYPGWAERICVRVGELMREHSVVITNARSFEAKARQQLLAEAQADRDEAAIQAYQDKISFKEAA